MARIGLAPEVIDDFDRVFDHASASGSPSSGAERVREIVAAIDVLGHSPLIGRKVAGGLRELVIGRASHGYVALYRYLSQVDTGFVLAVRSQRESGYRHGP